MATKEQIEKTGLRVWTITAWIHSDDGDDYQTSWTVDTTGYGNTVKDIDKLTRKLIYEKGSVVMDDYTISLNGCRVPTMSELKSLRGVKA